MTCRHDVQADSRMAIPPSALVKLGRQELLHIRLAMMLSPKAKPLLLRRCWELLLDHVTPLDSDLHLLATDAGSSASETAWFEQMHAYYKQVMQGTETRGMCNMRCTRQSGLANYSISLHEHGMCMAASTQRASGVGMTSWLCFAKQTFPCSPLSSFACLVFAWGMTSLYAPAIDQVAGSMRSSMSTP